MTFEEALTQRILGAPVASRLARWLTTRAVHWGERPEGAGLPAIVFTMIDPGIDHVHGGRDALRIPSLQADVLAEDYGTAREIADAIGVLLEGPAVIEGIAFTHGFVEREADIPVVGVKGARSVFGRSLTFSLYCKE